MAKSTLARGVAELLPAGEFVTLPLGASEERIVGSLDLDAALGEGRARFSPGVLAKADGGVLYVDEVNLLPDHLVDLLLDVAASGVNLVERDGISHRHPARFVLIGTMNPEEGELRPQLLDRFGLNVRLDTQPPPAERAAAEAFLQVDGDPGTSGEEAGEDFRKEFGDRGGIGEDADMPGGVAAVLGELALQVFHLAHDQPRVL